MVVLKLLMRLLSTLRQCRQSALSVCRCQVAGDLSEVINILAKSPLEDNVAGISDWDYTGKTISQLDLAIPMSKREEADLGGRVSLRGQYNVSTTIDKGSIGIPDRPISMTDIQGQLNFSVQDGLYGEGIRGNFWQRQWSPACIKLVIEQKIAFSGDLLPKSLNQLVEFPWQKVVVGAVPIEGLITIPTVSEDSRGYHSASQQSACRALALDCRCLWLNLRGVAGWI